jgi:predicted transcriptional regulator
VPYQTSFGLCAHEMAHVSSNPGANPSPKGKRAFLEVARDVLEVARQSARPTHIMYRANLNHAQLNRYLHRLIEAGLMTVDPDRRMYSLTDHGLRFIRDYDEMRQAAQVSAAKNAVLTQMLNGQSAFRLRHELSYG